MIFAESYRPVAAMLPDQMGVAVSIPGVAKRRLSAFLRHVSDPPAGRPRVNAVGDHTKERLRFRPRVPRAHLAHLGNLHADRLTLSLQAKVSLDHEAFRPRPYENEEARELSVARTLLTLGRERQVGDILVGQRQAKIGHFSNLGEHALERRFLERR